MIALMLAAVSSQAAPVTTTFCARYGVSYTDVNEELPQLDDDFFRDNDYKPALGARLKLVNKTLQTSATYWLDDESEMVAGKEVSCVDVDLNDAFEYDIKLNAAATIDSHQIWVLNNDASSGLWTHLADTDWTPVTGIRLITTPTHQAWNIAAAAGFAVDRRDAGLSSQSFTFYTQACPCADLGLPPGCNAISCQNGSALYIEPDHWDLKTVPVHELGHAIAEAKNGWDYEITDPTEWTNVPCTDDYSLLTAEWYSSKAAVEGIAWFYAAIVFNEKSGSDCEVAWEGNYDGLGGVDPDENEHTPSCEGDSTEAWATEDYLDDECSVTASDHGTSLDWMRAMWDTVQAGASTTQVFEMWNLANPDTWDVDGGGSSSDDPAERMAAGAALAFISGYWGPAAATNGVR